MRGACLASGEGYADNKMSKKTVARFFAYFCYIICKDFDKNANEKIGGEDDVVEIDESLCGKLKFGRGDPSKRRQTWAFEVCPGIPEEHLQLYVPKIKEPKPPFSQSSKRK